MGFLQKSSFSFRVETGLCNPGFYSFTYLGKGPNQGHYLGLNNKLQAGCASEYKAPSSDVVLLSPAEVASKPQDATWMLVDKDDLSGNFDAECGGEWAMSFALAVLIGAVAYVGGGVAYGKKSFGRSGPALEAHPHFSKWLDLRSLTMDGVSYSRARMQCQSSSGKSGYEKLTKGATGGEGEGEGSKDLLSRICRQGFAVKDLPSEPGPEREREERQSKSGRSSKSSKSSGKDSGGKSGGKDSSGKDKDSSSGGKNKKEKRSSGKEGKSSSGVGGGAADRGGGGGGGTAAEQAEEAEAEAARMLQEVRDDSGVHTSQAKIKVQSLLG